MLDLTRKVTDDIRTVDEILGHNDVNRTMIYTDSAEKPFHVFYLFFGLGRWRMSQSL
jgi:hypothetical protein